MKFFSVSLLKGVMVLVKIGLIGALVKAALTLLFSYSDLITEMFVLWSYQTTSGTGLLNASESCISSSLVIQAIFTFFQYRLSHVLS